MQNFYSKWTTGKQDYWTAGSGQHNRTGGGGWTEIQTKLTRGMRRRWRGVEKHRWGEWAGDIEEQGKGADRLGRSQVMQGRCDRTADWGGAQQVNKSLKRGKRHHGTVKVENKLGTICNHLCGHSTRQTRIMIFYWPPIISTTVSEHATENWTYATKVLTHQTFGFKTSVICRNTWCRHLFWRLSYSSCIHSLFNVFFYTFLLCIESYV